MMDAAYPGIFVTGTDTEIGKTVCSCLLIEALQQRGLRVAGMKPVASGGQYRQGQLVNPYVFELPVAPHLAARQAGVIIRPEPIQQAFTRLKTDADQIVVEGVGGWRVPLAEDFSVSDLPPLLNLPVVLVIGMRLGCLNHALLTIESIEQTGIKLLGWMANYLDPGFDAQQANYRTLESRLDAPCLAQIPYHCEPFTPTQQRELAASINISWL